MKDLSNEVMVHKKSGNLQYLQFRRLLEYDDILIHAFTTRHGGVSTGTNSTLNFGLNNDDRQNVLKNYQIICDELNIGIKNIICTMQTHSNRVEVVTRNDRGAGLFQNHIAKSYDGIITNHKDAILRTVSADCTLIILFDPVRKVVANIHAGWRGVAGEIIKNTIEQLTFYYKCNTGDIIACCGPALNVCCFEFSKSDIHNFESYSNIEDVIIEHQNPHKCYVDLSKIIKHQLIQNGITEDNIELSNICTMCNKDMFYSHRGENGNTGRQVMIVGLR